MSCKVEIIKSKTWNSIGADRVTTEFTINEGEVIEVEKQVVYNLGKPNNVVYYHEGRYVITTDMAKEVGNCSPDRRRLGENYRRILNLIVLVTIIFGLYTVSNQAALAGRKSKRNK